MAITWSFSTLLLLLLSSSLLIMTILCLGLPQLFSRNKSRNDERDELKPPPRLPITSLLRMKSLLDLGPTLSRLRPIVDLRLGLFRCFFIVDRRLTHEALIEKGANFASRPPLGTASTVFSANGHTVSFSSGPLWRSLRRNLASQVAHPSRLKAFAGHRRLVLRKVLGDISEAASRGNEVVVSRIFPGALHRLCAFMCFGEVEEKVLNELEQVFSEITSMFWKLNLMDFVPLSKLLLWLPWRRFLAVYRRQNELLVPLVRARKIAREQKQKPEDGGGSDAAVLYADTLLDLELEEKRKLTEEEIVCLCAEFFNAVIDVVGAAMEWTLANVVKHSEVQRKLVEEIRSVVPTGREIEEEDLQRMPYLRAVVLESLRRHPPGHFVLPTEAAADTSIGGYAIPKGSRVSVAVAEMGWDEEVWEKPLEFRPERFMQEGVEHDLTGSREITFMPFGVGRRSCPGMDVATLYLRYYLASLVREFEWSTAAGEDGVDLTEVVGLAVIPKNPLRARVSPRILD